MFHKHNYVESSTDNKIIYCTICGKTKILPCNHNFEVITSFTTTDWYTKNVKRIEYVKRCSKCNKHTVETIQLEY